MSLYRHKKLEQAQECPEYLILNGVRSGCNFTGITLPDFTDINFCLNGSSPRGPLKPTFISLQIQNHGTCMFSFSSSTALTCKLRGLLCFGSLLAVLTKMCCFSLSFLSCNRFVFLQWSLKPQRSYICKQARTRSWSYTGTVLLAGFLETA